jgi:adenine deaminase
VSGLIEGQIVTEALRTRRRSRRGSRSWIPRATSPRIAAVECHLDEGWIGLGFVRGFALQRGAMASTIVRDAHNIVVVGVE